MVAAVETEEASVEEAASVVVVATEAASADAEVSVVDAEVTEEASADAVVVVSEAGAALEATPHRKAQYKRTKELRFSSEHVELT